MRARSPAGRSTGARAELASCGASGARGLVRRAADRRRLSASAALRRSRRRGRTASLSTPPGMAPPTSRRAARRPRSAAWRCADVRPRRDRRSRSPASPSSFALLYVAGARLMSRRRRLRARRLARRARLPRLRALPRGAVLDERPGHRARSSSTRSSSIALGYPLGLYMARVYTTTTSRARRLRCLGAIERGFYRLVARRRRRASRTGRATRRPCSSSASSSRSSSTRSSGSRGTSS